jgi:DNA-binding CsgD family transcriptional regulator
MVVQLRERKPPVNASDGIYVYATDGRPVWLSEREHVVLRAFCEEGASFDEIRRRLGLHRTTVKNHSTTLYEKLGVPSRGAAVAHIVSSGQYEHVTGHHPTDIRAEQRERLEMIADQLSDIQDRIAAVIDML